MATEGDQANEGLNWWIAGLVTLLGVGAIGGGLYLAEFGRDAWSDVLIGVGTAIGLVAVLAFLERRLIARTRTTAESAARTAAREVTDAIEGRLVRLEELDDAQLQSREERRRQAESTSEAVRTEGLDATRVGELVRGAVASNLFAVEDGIRVRTSEAPDCPLLHVLVVAFPSRSWVFLDFEQIIYSGATIEGVPVPDGSDTIVLWDDESAGEIAGRLEASLERLNVAPDKFRFRYALDRLVRSVEIMRAARAAESDSPLRLEGRLRVLINDEWVLTDWGLESVKTSRRFEGERGWLSPGVSGVGLDQPRQWLYAITVPDDERDSPPELVEALAWITDRERLTIKAPGGQPGPVATRL